MGLLTGVLSLAREPARLTLRVWELGLSSAASVARLGLELLDQESSGAFAAAERYPPPPPAEAGNGRAPRQVDVEPPVAPAAPVADPLPAVPDALIPDHVDEEVVLVAEVAEAGAEGGAGPEVRIEEPWEGYDEMTAPQINDRLAAATAELAATVELYESIRKCRRTVIEAAERALRA